MTFVEGQLGQLAFLNNINDPWTAYTPVLTGFTGTVAYSKYQRIGKTVRFQVVISVAAVTSSMFVSLPVSPAFTSADISLGAGVAYDGGVAYYNLTAMSQAANTRVFFIPGGSGNIAGAAVPFTWGVGDQLSFAVTYEAA